MAAQPRKSRKLFPGVGSALLLTAVVAVAALANAAPAFASPVPGARYEGVYSTPGLRINAGQAEIEAGATRLIAQLLTCTQPAGLTPGLDFQVSRTGRMAGFASDGLRVREIGADGELLPGGLASIVALSDARGSGDDLGIDGNGDFERILDVSGTVSLGGREAPIVSGSDVLIIGFFDELPTRQGCPRPKVEAVYGVFSIRLVVAAPDGTQHLLFSEIYSFGGYACTLANGQRQVRGCEPTTRLARAARGSVKSASGGLEGVGRLAQAPRADAPRGAFERRAFSVLRRLVDLRAR